MIVITIITTLHLYHFFLQPNQKYYGSENCPKKKIKICCCRWGHTPDRLTAIASFVPIHLNSLSHAGAYNSFVRLARDVPKAVQLRVRPEFGRHSLSRPLQSGLCCRTFLDNALSLSFAAKRKSHSLSKVKKSTGMCKLYFSLGISSYVSLGLNHSRRWSWG